MNDKIVFDFETGIMTINDIYEIKPRMTLPEVLDSNLMELLTEYNNIGIEYIQKEGIESDIIFRDFNVDGVNVRINPELSYDPIREVREIEIFVGDLGRDPSIEEFQRIHRMHERFLEKICININGNRDYFKNGSVKKRFNARIPHASIAMTFFYKEDMEISEKELNQWMDDFDNELFAYNGLLDNND